MEKTNKKLKKHPLKSSNVKVDRRLKSDNTKTINKEELKTTKEIISKLLKLLGAEKIKIKASQKRDEGIVHLNINCLDPDILIGERGETIFSLQLILSLMIYKKLGRWQRILVNINDYLEQRAESLKSMALDVAQRVKFSGKEERMPFLNSAERRIIHLVLVDSPDVATESIGEGRERRLVIKPRK